MTKFKSAMIAFVACYSAINIFAAEIPEPTVEPKKINPGPPPSDAIVLFDGKDLSKWVGKDGGAAKWKITGKARKVKAPSKGGELLYGSRTVPQVDEGEAVVNGTGSISTKESFGDCQLHVEWA